MTRAAGHGGGPRERPGLLESLRRLPSTPLHPQWLSNRYHARSRRALRAVSAATVLDIGSGDSDSGRWLGAHERLVRIDYPQTNARYRNPPDLFADACRLPLADGCADVVLLLEVLEHVPDADAALAEASRVLRAGGRLFVSVPPIYPIHDAPHDYRRFTIHGLRAMLSRHDLVPRVERQHGNSWVTALQLLALAALEWVMLCNARHPALGLAAAALAYPLCLACNLLALPFLALRGPSRSCFGYFVEAVRA